MSEEQLKLIEQLPGSYLDKCRAAARCPEDEALLIWLRGMVRLDDPVVTGLVEALEEHSNSMARFKALSAYEARVKPIQEP